VVPTSQSAGWWPETAFDWRVTENHDGSSTLAIRMYPFYYNPQTSDVKFYKNYSFDIQVITSTVEVQLLASDESVYAQGGEVAVDLWLKNSRDPEDVIVDVVLLEESSGEVIDGLMLEALDGLVGLASFETEWDSSGVEPDKYAIRAEVRDSSGNVLGGATVDLEVGIHAGEITSFTAAPELFDIGDTVGISTAFRNTGTVPITGTAVVEVQTLPGFTTTVSFTHAIADLAPSSTVALDDDWDTSGGDEGSYRVVGHVKYHSTSTDPVAVTVGTVTDVYLPLVLRGSPQ
jgi:uncharacterized repeat protein (TIGR01451 family)